MTYIYFVNAVIDVVESLSFS